jgi:hypothetical protein
MILPSKLKQCNSKDILHTLSESITNLSKLITLALNPLSITLPISKLSKFGTHNSLLGSNICEVLKFNFNLPFKESGYGASKST